MKIVKQKEVEKVMFRINYRDVILDKDLARFYGLNIKYLRKKIKEIPSDTYFIMDSINNINVCAIPLEGFVALTILLKDKMYYKTSISILDAYQERDNYVFVDIREINRLEKMIDFHDKKIAELEQIAREYCEY